MLHEIILSLSGHPSVLFNTDDPSKQAKSAPFPLLSPPEAELLSSIGRLSYLHLQTRRHALSIASSHSSAICRAVATAITSHHLEKFQRKVQDVEQQILLRDSATVGAYNIVPLARIVNEFSGWTRLMEWLWSIANFILPSGLSRDEDLNRKERLGAVSGAEIIDKLRLEAQTGYPEIEEAAVYLGKIAEASWLRQLSGWVLYGHLPSFGAADFFIHPATGESEDGMFVANHKLLPNFVSRQTASSILFIGKSLHQIKSFSSSSKGSTGPAKVASELELLPTLVKQLSEVSTPISSAKLSEAIANIRLSLSRNLLQQLLPIDKILEILMVLQGFFLLGRGEFAMALISEADKQIRSRTQGSVKARPGVQNILLKEGEITSALTRSWFILSSLAGDETGTDDLLDLASKIIHLGPTSFSSNRPGTPGRARESTSSFPNIKNVQFTDFLFPSPTSLTLDIQSPLDLFLTNPDLEIYSIINSYLLSLRRAHIHLTQLWRQSSIRKEHPAPPGPQYCSSSHGKAILRNRRRRYDKRGREMRKVWATCSAAVFFLSESEAYFQGEVIHDSWKTFRDWILNLEHAHQAKDPESETTGDAANESLLSASKSGKANSGSEKPEHHDPETLASAHRKFLSGLAYALLLTDSTFPAAMRDLFRHVDELVALITRLQVIWQNLDLEEDDGVEDALTNYKQEEKEVELDLDRARKRLDGDLKTLIARLRDVDGERVGGGGLFSSEGMGEGPSFEAGRVGGVDRLLMKLDWGDVGSEEEEG